VARLVGGAFFLSGWWYLRKAAHYRLNMEPKGRFYNDISALNNPSARILDPRIIDNYLNSCSIYEKAAEDSNIDAVSNPTESDKWMLLKKRIDEESTRPNYSLLTVQ